MKKSKEVILLMFLLLPVTLNSCVGSITNNIEKIEGKIDSNINAEAKVNTSVDTKLNANVNTDTSQNKTTETVIKDLDRFSEVRATKARDEYTDYNSLQSRLFDDNKKIDSFSFSKIGLKGNLNSYIEILYDNNGLQKSNNLVFEYQEVSKVKSLSINSNGDFETINNGGGDLIIKDNKNKISKKIGISVYDRSLIPKDAPIFTRPPIQTSSPVPTIIPTPSILPTVTPTLTSTPLPTQSSNISQIKPRISGKVFDTNGVEVASSTVNLILDGKIVSSYDTKEIAGTVTSYGYFEFNNLLFDKTYSVEVSRRGWTSKIQEIFTKDEGIYYLNFQGDFAIQDEPEIIETKINGKLSTFAGGNDNPPTSSTVVTLPDLSGGDLKVELTFSEAIDRSSVENGFNIIGLNTSNNKRFRLDNNLNGASYSFSSDNKKFTAIFPSSILSGFLGKNQKIVGRIEFETMFKDSESRAAINDKSFNFGKSKAGYTTFSFITSN